MTRQFTRPGRLRMPPLADARVPSRIGFVRCLRGYARSPVDKEVEMAKSEDELQAQRQQMGQGQPGGRSSRGPEPDPGGTAEPQGLTPPYNRDDSPEDQAVAADGVGKAFRADEYGGEPGPPPPVSKEEREGVPPTDTSAATPLGVGESTSTGGEELAGKEGKEAGREDTGMKGPAQRPTGTSTGEDSTGIDPQGSTGGSPNVTSGDQGG
jgi:hypothetical protein